MHQVQGHESAAVKTYDTLVLCVVYVLMCAYKQFVEGWDVKCVRVF